ncbi:MAG TPA: hypothetical protein VMT30_01655 [Candidatus Saccharimonadia bacterium]|nr:hypothetical protein [Candidatus Saccharimonadia bacterium]
MSVDTIFVDAGFRNPDYLDEVCGSSLDHDLADAEDADLPEVAEQIRAKIAELEALRDNSV